MRLLIFSRTTGFRHDSIPAGIAAVSAFAAEVTATEDPSWFSPERLSRFDCLVFLSTSGTVLDSEAQRAALEGYVRGGGPFVGIHAATTTEPDWPFYRELLGARFTTHPEVQPARLRIEDPDHPSTAHLPKEWDRTDEWYDFDANPRADVHVLLTIDETSYTGGALGADHPLAWCHDRLGGRMFYTALGHTVESYSEPAFLDHVRGGLDWAVG